MLDVTSILTQDDMELGGYNSDLLPEGKYVMEVLPTITACLTPTGKRKIRVGLKPVSTLDGDKVTGKIVNHKVAIDRVVTKDGKSFAPIGKLFAALGWDMEQSVRVLSAIHEAFPSAAEFAQLQEEDYGQIEIHPSVGGEPVDLSGTVKAEIRTKEFSDKTYNAVGYFLARD